MEKITLSIVIKLIAGLIFIGVLLFLPAGTYTFWNGWLFLGAVLIPVLITAVLLYKKSPELLKKRLDTKEKLTSQKWVIRISGVMFLLGFLVSGLSYRYQWGRLPSGISVIASAMYLCFYFLYLEVMRENPYLSRTVTVCENQKVIDTGMYAILRHPLYAVTLGLFFMMPLMLGSWVAFFVFLCYPLIIVIRIQQEEHYLTEHLDGYLEYKKRVKYRLIPFIW